jgi:hypothetical protein
MTDEGRGVQSTQRLAAVLFDNRPGDGPPTSPAPFEREELSTPDGRRLLLYWGDRTPSAGDGGQ